MSRSFLLLVAAFSTIAAALLLVSQLILYVVSGTYSGWWTIGSVALLLVSVYVLYGDLWRSRRRRRPSPNGRP